MVGSWMRWVGEASMDKASCPWFPHWEKGLNNFHFLEQL